MNLKPCNSRRVKIPTTKNVEKKIKILAVLSHRIILFYVRFRILKRDGNISILFHQLFSILYYAADESRVAASQHFKNFADHEVLIKSF